MPSTSEHLSQAAHNEQFLSSLPLSSTPFLDWAVTGLFYAALHHIDAYLGTMNIHPQKHTKSKTDFTWGRNEYVREVPGLSSIWKNYEELANKSREARYGTPGLGFKQFTEPEVSDLRNQDFSAIKSHVKALLGIR